LKDKRYGIQGFNLNNEANQKEKNTKIHFDSGMVEIDSFQKIKRRNDEKKGGNTPKVIVKENNILDTLHEDSKPKKDTSFESILHNNNKDLQGNLNYEDNLSNDQANENISRLLDIMEANAKQMNNIGKSNNSFENEKFNDGSDNMAQAQANSDIGNLLDIMEGNAVHDNSRGKMHNHIEKGSLNTNFDKRVLDEISNNLPLSESVTFNGAIDQNDVSHNNALSNHFFEVTKDNTEFTGINSKDNSLEKELFRAEIYETDIFRNGSLIQIHLLEDLSYEKNIIIPKNTLFYGKISLSSTRMFIKISPNIYKNQNLLSHPILAYDFDGLEGVFVETNISASIPYEASKELTELVKESYRSSNALTGNANTVSLADATKIISTEKIFNQLDRLKIKIYAGHRLWLSVKKTNR